MLGIVMTPRANTPFGSSGAVSEATIWWVLGGFAVLAAVVLYFMYRYDVKTGKWQGGKKK